MAIPNEFFTPQSMVTFSGAAGATFVICNGLQSAFDFNPKWLALIVAQVIILAGVYAAGGAAIIDYAIGVVNGFLVYCTAVGATSALGGGERSEGIPRGGTAANADLPHPPSPPRRSFLTPWF